VEVETAATVARRLADEMERAGIPYAIGGAIAYGFWGAARGTSDVDINVFVPHEELDRVFVALRAGGCAVDEQAARAKAADRGEFQAFTSERMRIDVFVPSIPFYDEALRRRVLVANMEGRPGWILSAETIAIFKLMFFRTKDIPDLEQIVINQGDRLDRAFIRASLVDMVGEDDPRVAKWDEIVRVFGRRP
jgi:hypothetical protein